MSHEEPDNPDFMNPVFDISNVQGDISHGFSKNLEDFVFFEIINVEGFRQDLKNLIPLITTGQQVEDDKNRIRKYKEECRAQGILAKPFYLRHVNIAFTRLGITKILGQNRESIGDQFFEMGQLKDAESLNDPKATAEGNPYEPDWDPKFKQPFDGVFVLSADSQPTLDERWGEVAKIFRLGTLAATAIEVHRVSGNTRPDASRHHEHFGFLDGISNPAISGVNFSPNPGQTSVPQGVIFMGRYGDFERGSTKKPVSRPNWALDGSLMAFRELHQLVPEFNRFLKENPVYPPIDIGITREEASELTGARLMGRWKSGAPLTITPWQDDPLLGKDGKRNDHFRYDEDMATFSQQFKCPFVAHTREANPRNDLEGIGTAMTPFRIARRGIAFGKELQPEEIDEDRTIHPRGLLFVSYQANLDQGFREIQTRWSNNPKFPERKPIRHPGFDPIIGQSPPGVPRRMTGLDPSDPNKWTDIPPWVIPRGGEYFFSPSIPALKNFFVPKSS